MDFLSEMHCMHDEPSVLLLPRLMNQQPISNLGWLLTVIVASGACHADVTGESKAPGTQALPSIVVSASRVTEPELQVPASISVLEVDPLRGGSGGSGFAQSLAPVPGLVAQDRLSYAQDLQISLRGYGARASFGVRGIRILMDGLPYTLPDGQSQTDPIALSVASRIEVLRGPNSVMYGNAAGGVIQVFSTDAPAQPEVGLGIRLGSESTREEFVNAAGASGELDYVAAFSRFDSDGYRRHSAARRDHLYAKLSYRPDRRSVTSLILNGENQPFAEDPSSLNAEQLAEDPRQAVARVFQFGAGEFHRHRQAGLVHAREFGDSGLLNLTVWSGSRRVVQFLPFAGDEPLSSGAVVDLDNTSMGGSLFWSGTGDGTASAMRWSAGMDFQGLHEERKGFINDEGIKGALARDEDNASSNLGAFTQWRWSIDQWHLDAGIRHSRVAFNVDDHFINANNPDDSGELNYARTTSFAGLSWQASLASSAYLSLGNGFETPTFAELAYRPDGQSGLNLSLKPATSRQVELGYKADLSERSRLRLALYSINSNNEIITASNIDGRSTFRNAGETSRKGLEASLDGDLAKNLEGSLAWTLLDARYSSEPFTGMRLPGVPRHTFFGSLRWTRSDGKRYASANAMWRGRMVADDANLHAAGGNLRMDLEAGVRRTLGGWHFDGFLRLDNVLDRRSVAAVVVNAGNGRYYQPAADRTILIGINVRRTVRENQNLSRQQAENQ